MSEKVLVINIIKFKNKKHSVRFPQIWNQQMKKKWRSKQINEALSLLGMSDTVQ